MAVLGTADHQPADGPELGAAELLAEAPAVVQPVRGFLDVPYPDTLDHGT